MSLSIDYITMAPKSQEVSQIQHGEQVRYDQANQEAAAQLQQQVKQSSEQTIRRAKAENQEFRYHEKDKKGKGQKKDGKGRRPQKENQQDDKASFSDVSRFDMRI